MEFSRLKLTTNRINFIIKSYKNKKGRKLNERVKHNIKIFLCINILISLFVFGMIPQAFAAAVGNPKDTLTREAVSAAGNHVITFLTTSGVDIGDTVSLNFESDFDISAVVLADVSIDGNAPDSVSVNSQLLTITADADTVVTAGNTATIAITNNHIDNPSASGDYYITIGGTFGDTGKITVPILTNDRISITGDIEVTITFALSTTTCSLNTLTTGGIGSCGPFTYTVGTTAGAGYSVAVLDAGNGTSTSGLYKGALPNNLIASTTATLVAGAEGYGVQGAVNTGSQTIAATYLKTSDDVGGLNLTPTTISSYNNATPSNQVTEVTVKAAIAAGTPSGTYSDTLTFLATGNF